MARFGRSVIFAFFFLLAGLAARAADASAFVFQRLNQDQGLSNNAVRAIAQDRRGFLWIATEDGLNRFDGFTFKVYRNRAGDPRSLPVNFVRSLYVDHTGTLWLGLSRSGVCRYDEATDSFVTFDEAPFRDQAGRISGYVLTIFEDHAGNVWFGHQYGLVKLDRATGTFTRHTPPFAPPNPSDVNNRTGGGEGRIPAIQSIVEDARGTLWLGTSTGLLTFDPPSGRFKIARQDPHPTNGLGGVGGLVAHPDGRIFYFAERQGLFAIDPATRRETKIPLAEADPFAGSPDSISFNSVFENDHTLWISGDQAGLVRVDLRDGAMIRLRNDPKRPDSLPGNRPLALFRDRGGVLWVGDGVNGLGGHAPFRSKFRAYRHNPYDDNSLSDNYIRGIHEDRAGNLWVATQQGGLNRIDPAGTVTRFSHRDGDSRSLPNNTTWAVLEDRAGVIWVGLFGAGLFRLDPKTGAVTKPALEPPDLLDPGILTLYEDRRSNLWIGTGRGAYRLAPDRRALTRFDQDIGINTGSLGNEVQQFYEDRAGNIWIGATRGCIRLNPETKQFKVFPEDVNPKFVGGAFVTGFLEDRNGTFWIVSKGGGLGRLDPASDRFIRIQEKDGLPHNNCYGIFEDANGFFWISSDAGIVKFDPRAMTFRSYGVADGTQGREFNRNSAYRNRSGEIFFGGTQGLNRFRPENVRDNPFLPPVAISRFTVGAREVIPDETERTISYEENSIRIEYVALDFTLPARNRYAYKLEGFDPDWQNADTRREAVYTNLPPGNYVFRVRGTNNDGVWNETGATLRFRVRPPFWRTWSAYLLYALSFMLAVYGGVRWRLRSLVARTRELEDNVARRTEEITRKNAELAARNAEIEEKTRDILESLGYARTIQQAVLPTEAALREAFGQSFILWKPKDIVSGDFYWMHVIGGLRYLVVADCTGHGVPGAFMSMIGNDLLNQIVVERGITEPAKILEELHLGIQRAFRRDDAGASEDGMDVAVCRFDARAGTLTFAGARRPLYFIGPDGELTELKGVRHSVGGGLERRPRQFVSQTLDIKRGAAIYLTTDGFADQNGGTTNRKYGARRLKQFLLDHLNFDPEIQQAALEKELEAHRGTEPQRDDITILGVILPPKPVPRPDAAPPRRRATD
jgi:ligand-binding sensor domain-containing protein/serine phosphatase RsbU (regulator of sigma subunit)